MDTLTVIALAGMAGYLGATFARVPQTKQPPGSFWAMCCYLALIVPPALALPLFFGSPVAALLVLAGWVALWAGVLVAGGLVALVRALPKILPKILGFKG